MIRKDLLAAIPVSIVAGMAGGVLLGRDLPDVLVVGLALAVLAVWTLTAGYVGALISRRGEADRFDEELQIALDLMRAALTDDDALALYRSLYEREAIE